MHGTCALKSVGHMGFEVSQHFLVPKHVRLPKTQTDALLLKLGITIDQMPVILTTDPAVKEIRAKENDLIKIIRDSPTAGKTVYYRRVVKPR